MNRPRRSRRRSRRWPCVHTGRKRPEAADTLRFFREEGVTVKLISGDDRARYLPSRGVWGSRPCRVCGRLHARGRRRSGRRGASIHHIRQGIPPAKTGADTRAKGRRAYGGHDGRRRERCACLKGIRLQHRAQRGQRRRAADFRSLCCWTMIFPRCPPW